MKFDIQIEGYNWVSSESFLALSGEFGSEFEVEVEGEEQVSFESVDGITPFFNWGGEAMADGMEIVVGSTVARNEILLVYPHFVSTLMHDPVVGYIVEDSPVPAVPSLTIILVVGIVIVGVLAVGLAVRSRRASAPS